MDKQAPTARYNVEAVERFSQIAALFTAGRGGITLHDIARALDIPLRSAAKIVGTMVHHDFLAVDPASKTYSPGFAWLMIADYRRKQMNVRDVALPVMRQIRNSINETVLLCIRAGERRIHIDYAESTQPIRRVPQAAFSDSPLHVGSAGRTLLAGLTDLEIDDYLARIEPVNYGYRTITDAKRIWQDIRHVRKQGYIVAISEITKDTASVSAPIRDYTGRTLASLTLTCPFYRFDDDVKTASIELIKGGAERISKALGYAE